MRKLIITFTSAVLFGMTNVIAAQQNGNPATFISNCQPETMQQHSIKEESEEFTNNCDIPDSLINYGVRLYNQALELQNKAKETDSDSEYTIYQKHFYEVLEASLFPFEKAFELLKRDKTTKVAISEYLRMICFVLSRWDHSYGELYEKYNEYYISNS